METPSITWDAQSRCILINGRPLVELEGAAREEQSADMPAGTGMPVPPHVAAKSLASTALLNLTAAAVGAGGVMVANSVAKKGGDASVIKPPAPKNKPKF